ncbi:MAG: hypothetical protein GOMPHAMPRED_002348 [Gomphillus americanus]|uniref:Uncharacterized protein n=1 Tax=Gomphillus americanus TaxID=1940652 RepID=A0A8H3FC31_9LECA|nr:MAG: hypothetical protein GOMPHAMPRED_002348 [Gomphillus americanus]
MPRGPYSSAHFLPMIDNAVRHSSHEEKNQERSRTTQLPRQRVLVPSSETLETSASCCVYTDPIQTTTRALNLAAASPCLLAKSSEQDTEYSITENLHARDSVLTQQKLIGDLDSRPQSEGTIAAAMAIGIREPPVVPSQGRLNGSKQRVISASNQSRSDSYAYQQSNSNVYVRNTKPTKAKTTLATTPFSKNAKLACTADRNRSTKSQSHHSRSRISDEQRDGQVKITAGSNISKASPIAPSEHFQTGATISISTLYHDFIKEISHTRSKQDMPRQHHPPQDVVKNSAVPVLPDLVSSDDDLTTLPEFVFDPSCDLTSPPRSNSLKTRQASVLAHLDETHSNLLYSPNFQSTISGNQHPQHEPAQQIHKQNITWPIDFQARSHPQHHFQCPSQQHHHPPHTTTISTHIPKSSRSFYTSTPPSSFSRIHDSSELSGLVAPSSLNSSHLYNLLMLRSTNNTPHQHSSSLTALEKKFMSTTSTTRTSSQTASSFSSFASEAEEEAKEDLKANISLKDSDHETESIYAYTFLFENEGDLSLTTALSAFSETTHAVTIAATQFDGKDIAPDLTLLTNTNATHLPPPPSSSSPQIVAVPHQWSIHDHHQSNKYTPSQTTVSSVDSSTSYEPCPSPKPVLRSRPVPRILHSAPWLEDDSSSSSSTSSLRLRRQQQQQYGKSGSGVLGQQALSWTEIWAVDTNQKRKKKGKGRGRLLWRMLGRM